MYIVSNDSLSTQTVLLFHKRWASCQNEWSVPSGKAIIPAQLIRIIGDHDHHNGN